MPALSLCINSQTPLLQFLTPEGAVPPPEGVEIADLREGTDYRYSPGGVTRMVYPLLRRLVRDRVVDEAHWVALNPNGPRQAHFGEITLHNVAIEPDRMAGYGKVKEAIWGRIHEIQPEGEHDELFWSDAFSEYTYYNRNTAELIRKLDGEFDFDVFYIHDFQQLPVGHMLGTLKPKIFRWHIPLDASSIPEKWRALLGTYLSSYDLIVVSAKRYADSLREFHPKGRIVRQYPYVDPSDYSVPDPATVRAVADRYGLAEEDTVALVVARMDPMKGHDHAISALGRLAGEFEALKLVLVGNGSFSGSGAGLGLTKSARWKAHLESMVRERGLQDRVVFAGYVGQSDLDGLYERCDFTILPSTREGFGLVAVESWLHGRPTVITERAGIAELVEDGTNGLLFEPERPGHLEKQMRRLLEDRSRHLHEKLAKNGRTTARKCTLGAAARSERAMLARITEARWLTPA